MTGVTTTFLSSVTLTLCLATFVAAATRCYGNLGCFDSGNLHALPQEPKHIRTEFRVSCRIQTNDVIIQAMSSSEEMRKKIEDSCFQVGLPTKFIIHGFNDDASSRWVKDLTTALLQREESNVVAVDWHHGGRFPYEQAVANTYLVSRQVAAFIRNLETLQGLDPLLIHLIGHSLGAQISGNTGHELYPSFVARITGGTGEVDSHVHIDVRLEGEKTCQT